MANQAPRGLVDCAKPFGASCRTRPEYAACGRSAAQAKAARQRLLCACRCTGRAHDELRANSRPRLRWCLCSPHTISVRSERKNFSCSIFVWLISPEIERELYNISNRKGLFYRHSLKALFTGVLSQQSQSDGRSENVLSRSRRSGFQRDP